MSQVIQQNREVNLEHVHQNLKPVWNNICTRASLVQSNGQALLLPMSRLLEAPSRNYNDIIVNMANRSLHTPIQLIVRPQFSSRMLHRRISSISFVSTRMNDPLLFSFDILSIYLRNSTTKTIPYSSVTSRSQRPSASLINLKDSALPVYSATMSVTR